MKVRRLCSILRQLSALAVLLAAAWSFGPSTPAYADVSVPNIFGDHMVLQRDQPNKGWGKAAGAAGVARTRETTVSPRKLRSKHFPGYGSAPRA